MDTLLFCWDQVIIGRDVAEWISEIVPALVAVLFYILRSHLKGKSTVNKVIFLFNNIFSMRIKLNL